MLWLLCLTMFTVSSVAELQSNIKIKNENFYVSPPATGNDVTLCVRRIVTELIDHKQFIIDVMLMNINDALQLHKLHGIKRARFITRSFPWTKSKLFSRVIVTSATDFEEFTNSMKQIMDDYYFNPRSNFIIVLEKYKYYDHKRMVNFLVFQNVYNVTILARNGDETDYTVYSFQSPIHPCNRKEKMIAVAHCSTYEKGSNIYPRLENIRNCNFRLMTYNLFPLINLDNPKEEGIEQRILRFFEKYADIKIDLVPYSRMDKFGQIVGNFTYTDILQKVLDNYAEGAVGGYFLSSTQIQIFSYSYPLTIDHMMVILPRSNFEESWQAIFNHKALPVITLICFLIFIFSIAAYILSLFPAHKSDIIRDTLIVFGYFLNRMTIHKFKSGVPESLIISSFLFSIFIIPYTIQSYMWSIKTHPSRAYEPKTFDEVYGYRKLILTSEWLRDGLYKDRQECDSIIDCLKQVRDSKDKSLYTLVTDETYETFKWMMADEQCNLGLYKLREPMSILMRSIFFRRGSVLEEYFNKFTYKVISAGFIDRHYKEIIFREQLKCKSKYVPAFTPLQMSDFKRYYNFLFVGSCVSAVCFAFEVLTHRI